MQHNVIPLRRDRPSVLLLSGFSLLKLLIGLYAAFPGVYGYFRDEFYYLDCASNLAWGYVDQPPLSLLILAITRSILGPSVLAIRLPVILAGVATVFVSGLIARAMGGGRFSQALTCLCVLVAPVHLTMNSFFSMNAFDLLLWAVAVYLLVLIIQTGNARLWIWFGIVAGLGLENKLSMGFLGATVAVSLILTPQRKYYLDKHLWIAGGIAGILFLPHVLWQVAHHWPTLEFMRNASESKNVPTTFVKFLLGQLLYMNPAAAPIWICGLLFPFVSTSGRRFRLFGFTYLVLFLVFLWTNGKSYYLSPAYPMLLAMGAVWAEKTFLRKPWPRGIAMGILILFGVLLGPYAVPVLPPQAFIRYQTALGLKAPQQERAHSGVLPQHLGDRLGWEEMVAMVGAAYNKLDPDDRARCAVLVSNYGEAGAVNLFGPRYGLPHAISGYMNNYLWGPRGATGEVVLAYWNDRTTLDGLFEEVTEIARFQHPFVMDRQNNRPLYLCRRIRVPMKEAWPRFKTFK